MSIVKKAFDYTINLFNAQEELNDPYAKYLEIRRFTQIDWYSCGIQCAYAILDYFDLLESANELNKYKNKDGTDYEIIKKIFFDYGLKVSEKYNSTFQDIKASIDDGFPILTTINNTNHWVVLYGYSFQKNKITHLYIADPSLVRLRAKWSVRKFKQHWKKYDEKWIAVVKI